MESERVVLLGGPYDGKHARIKAGLPVIELPPPRSPTASFADVQLPAPDTLRHYVYRRRSGSVYFDYDGE